MSENRILIIEDHPMMRTAIRTAVTHQKDMAVIGEASSIEEGKRLIMDLQPDLLLLDLYLPDGNGLQLVQYRNAHAEGTKILVITSSSKSDDILAVIKAGAEGIIGKDSTSEQVQLAIHDVIDGKHYLMNRAVETLLRAFQNNDRQPVPFTETLSPRELQVVEILSRGATNREIAKELVLSESTVRTHLQRISQKLGTQNKRELVLYFARHYKKFMDDEQ